MQQRPVATTTSPSPIPNNINGEAFTTNRDNGFLKEHKSVYGAILFAWKHSQQFWLVRVKVWKCIEFDMGFRWVVYCEYEHGKKLGNREEGVLCVTAIEDYLD